MPRRLPIVAAACAAWLCCGAYVWPFVTRGWIAHDEGTIAQSAERTLQGQVPHRDFDEVYTGGVTYLHAGAMRALGVNLRSPRYVLFAGFMAFAAAAGAIAWRLMPGWGALAALAAVVVWSVPNYFASLPSWYTLFFATFGIFACLRFLDSRRRRWLVVAGVCGGCSILAKITGVYYLAAGFLFLAFVESTDHDGAGGRGTFTVVVGLPAAAALGWLASRAGSSATGGGLLQVFLPASLVVALVLWREWSAPASTTARRSGVAVAVADAETGAGVSGRDRGTQPKRTGPIAGRVRALGRLMLPFAAGAAVPIGAFIGWYWRMGALGALFEGVFVLPQRRLTDAAFNPPAFVAAALAVPCALLFLARAGRLLRSRLAAAGLAVVLILVLTAFHDPIVYRAVWAAARSLPLVAVIALVGLVARGTTAASRPAVLRAGLLVIMAAFLILIQVPYATPTYFCYAAPAVVLALTAIAASQPAAPRALHAVVAAFFIAFAIVAVNQSYGWNLGAAFVPYRPDRALAIDRGGLRVPADDAAVYETLVRIVRERAAGGTIYAGPDCPEVYFLSGFPNPTRAFFDFLSPVGEDEAWFRRLMDDHPIRAVVVNTAPLFSPPMDPRLLAVVDARFPASVSVGRFRVLSR